MKTMLIIVTLLGFQIFAASGKSSGDIVKMTVREYVHCTDCPSLLPVVPVVASYEDQKELVYLMRNESLLPSVPMEADFNDPPAQDEPDMRNLVPQVPATADFDDIP